MTIEWFTLKVIQTLITMGKWFVIAPSKNSLILNALLNDDWVLLGIRQTYRILDIETDGFPRWQCRGMQF